jgi:hypothetical protein
MFQERFIYYLTTGLIVIIFSIILHISLLIYVKKKKKTFLNMLKENKMLSKKSKNDDKCLFKNIKLIVGEEIFLINYMQEKPDINNILEKTPTFWKIITDGKEAFDIQIQRLILETYEEVKKEIETYQKNPEHFNQRQVAIQKFQHCKKSKTTSIYLYQTDYYTCKLLREVSLKLRKKENIKEETISNVLSSKHCFLYVNAVSVNSMILFSEKNEYDSFLLGIRNTRGNRDSIKQLPMSETINEKDFSNEQRELEIEKIVERGLFEELGIKDDMIYSIDIGSIYIVKKFYHVGIDSLVKLRKFDPKKVPINFNYIKRNAVDSYDFYYEFLDLEKHSFSSKTIKKLAGENHYFVPIVIKYYLSERFRKARNLIFRLFSNPFKK